MPLFALTLGLVPKLVKLLQGVVRHLFAVTGGKLFNHLESLHKLSVGIMQCHLVVYLVKTEHVANCKEKIPCLISVAAALRSSGV